MDIGLDILHLRSLLLDRNDLCGSGTGAYSGHGLRDRGCRSGLGLMTPHDKNAGENDREQSEHERTDGGPGE